MNTPTHNSSSSCVYSQAQGKDIVNSFIPLLSADVKSYIPYENFQSGGHYPYNVLIPSSPPIPKFTIDPNRSSSLSLIKLDDTDLVMRPKESKVIVNNCSASRLKSDIIDSTSGREDWTEEMDGDVGNEGGSHSTHLFSNGSNGDRVSSTGSQINDSDKLGFDCMAHFVTVIIICLGVVSFATPILMVVLPKVKKFGWDSTECSGSCESSLIFISVKLVILLIASMMLFCRRQTYSFPRVLIFKLVLIMLLFFIIFAFWLFFVLRILLKLQKKTEGAYDNIVTFASNVTDVLIFMHYLSLIMLEVRHLETRFCVKVIRSPDGECRFYQMGNLSIQAAAVQILQNYVLDFPMYNIYSRSHKQSSSRDNSNDMFNARSRKEHMDQSNSLAEKVFSARDNDSHSPLRRSTRSLGHSPKNSREERFPKSLTHSDIGYSNFRQKIYRDMEHEKRLKKRRLRLLASTEEAFNRLRKLSDEESNYDSSTKVLNSNETAQNLLVQLAKPFQKYLKLARLQIQFPKSRIQNHLTKCLQFGVSAQAFLESLITSPRVIETSEYIDGQLWTVYSNKVLSKGLSNNLTFMIKRENISLLCIVYHIPFFSLTEDIINTKSQRFQIKFNSETSV